MDCPNALESACGFRCKLAPTLWLAPPGNANNPCNDCRAQSWTDGTPPATLDRCGPLYALTADLQLLPAAGCCG